MPVCNDIISGYDDELSACNNTITGHNNDVTGGNDIMVACNDEITGGNDSFQANNDPSQSCNDPMPKGCLLFNTKRCTSYLSSPDFQLKTSLKTGTVSSSQ